MKIVADKLNYMLDGDGGMYLQVFIDKSMYHNQNLARRLVNELKDKRLELSIKELKSQRSIDQNALMWKVLEKLSLHINGTRNEADMMKLYGELLKRANVKRDYFRGIKESIPYFESIARAVVIAPNSERVENGLTTIGFWVYWGSSTYNIKEMTELIDNLLLWVDELGIDDSEIYNLRQEHRGNV